MLAPYPGAWAQRSFEIHGGFNRLLAHILPGLFACQALYVIKPRPSLDWFQQRAVSISTKEAALESLFR